MRARRAAGAYHGLSYSEPCPHVICAQVWHIRLTIHVLSNSGNMVDCACLAGIVALKHFRRPEVEVVGDEVTIVRTTLSLVVCAALLGHHVLNCAQHHPSERAPVPLSMHHTPFCLTFAFFPDLSTPPLLDPSHLEETLSAGLLTVALNAQRELCVVQKAGGIPLAPEDILKIMDIAVTKARELDKIVEARLQEDWKGRHVEVR